MKSLNAAAGFARALTLLSTLAVMALLSGLSPKLGALSGHVDPAGSSDIGVMAASTHDVSLTNCVAEGPAPVNLSDTAGAVMLVTCRITNLSDHDDWVVITAAGDLLTTSLPEGCGAAASLAIPGRTDFILLAGEQKQLLYRLRFECHAPAVESIVPLTIKIAVEHLPQPDGLGDINPSNNAVTLLDNLIIGSAPPATASPTPIPTPSPLLDRDGDGFTDATEANVGTMADKPCGGDGWPANLVHSGLSFNKLDLEDMSSFVAPMRRLNTSPGDTNFNKRWDLIPGAVVGDVINIQDMAALSPGTSSPMMYPPMFGGAKAYGQTCSWPP